MKVWALRRSEDEQWRAAKRKRRLHYHELCDPAHEMEYKSKNSGTAGSYLIMNTEKWNSRFLLIAMCVHEHTCGWKVRGTVLLPHVMVRLADAGRELPLRSSESWA